MTGGFPPIILIREKETKTNKMITKVSAYQLSSLLNIKDILKERKSEFIMDKNEDTLEIIKSF